MPTSTSPSIPSTAPVIRMGLLGLVLFMGCEAILFLSLFFAWMAIVSEKPVVSQATSELLQPHTSALAMTLLPLAFGSVIALFYKMSPRLVAALCGLCGILFLLARSTILVDLIQSPHDKTGAPGLVIFCMLSLMLSAHVVGLTLSALLRAAGITWGKLDLLPYFWHFSTLIGAISHALIFFYS